MDLVKISLQKMWTNVLTMPSSLRVPLSIASSLNCIWRSWLEPSGSCKEEIFDKWKENAEHSHQSLVEWSPWSLQLPSALWLARHPAIEDIISCRMSGFELVSDWLLSSCILPQHKHEGVRLPLALVGHEPETGSRHTIGCQIMTPIVNHEHVSSYVCIVDHSCALLMINDTRQQSSLSRVIIAVIVNLGCHQRH